MKAREFEWFESDESDEASALAQLESELGELSTMLDPARVMRPAGVAMLDGAPIHYFFRNRAWAVDVPDATPAWGRKLQRHLMSPRTGLDASDPDLRPRRLILLTKDGPITVAPTKRNPKNLRTAMVELLALLQAAYLTYRADHWTVRGDDYYGNHLLLQRIYEQAEKHVDSIAERIVGYWGGDAIDEQEQGRMIQEAMSDFSSGKPLEDSLLAAKTVREKLREVYDVMQAGEKQPLGLDDLLMSISSEKDEHVYLLQQALGVEAKVPNPRLTKLARRLANP